MNVIIQKTIRTLGITGCYKGFRQISYAIELAIVQRERLEAVVKEIYMETASYFGCSWSTVERNIRTVVAHAWQVNPDMICKMAGYPLEHVPESSEFIEIISEYIIRSGQLR